MYVELNTVRRLHMVAKAIRTTLKQFDNIATAIQDVNNITFHELFVDSFQQRTINTD